MPRCYSDPLKRSAGSGSAHQILASPFERKLYEKKMSRKSYELNEQRDGYGYGT
jgi:hypothetical protein